MTLDSLSLRGQRALQAAGDHGSLGLQSDSHENEGNSESGLVYFPPASSSSQQLARQRQREGRGRRLRHDLVFSRVVHALRLIASQPTRQTPPLLLPLAQLFPRTAPRIDTDLVDHNMKPSPRSKATAPSLPMIASGGFQDRRMYGCISKTSRIEYALARPRTSGGFLSLPFCFFLFRARDVPCFPSRDAR